MCDVRVGDDGQNSSHLNEAPIPSILIAVPGLQDGNINVTSLPSEERIATLPSPKHTKTGMVMALGLLYIRDSIHVLAGYESGHACIWRQSKTSKWEAIYLCQAHTQPILSLDVSSALREFYTSSADALIATHPLDTSGGLEMTAVQTKHAGQQSLTIRSDNKILATAGWDGRVRVYSTKIKKELAVLKWHKEGCYALAFADVDVSEGDTSTNTYDKSESSLMKRELTVQQRRTSKAQSTHWLAAGSKDGKVSLWDIY